MSFSSQLPPIPLAQASATLRALAQAAGQNIEAKVLSQSANGTTQVQVGRQTLNLQFPQPPPIGATLTLARHQPQGQLRVTLVSTQLPTSQASGATAASPASAVATSVQLSPAALLGSASTPVSS